MKINKKDKEKFPKLPAVMRYGEEARDGAIVITLKKKSQFMCKFCLGNSVYDIQSESYRLGRPNKITQVSFPPTHEVFKIKFH